MHFFEKLNFLMNITNTKNSMLAQKVNMDASHISRLRRGQRNAIKDEVVLVVMGNYFARYCTADYQFKALADTMELDVEAIKSKKLSKLIVKWLLKDNKMKVVENSSHDINSLNRNDGASNLLNLENRSDKLSARDISVHYGIEGKRQAAENFLTEVIAQNVPQTLLLYSDEETDWMTVDTEFYGKWKQLMIQVLSKGNKIKIIHTVSRNLDEMLSAITQWIPLYMTGLIEPYYYPKKRDGVFKRTMFISPDVCAVISNSIGSSINRSANLFIRSSNVISTYTEEFNLYLNECKPLMRIFTKEDRELYVHTLEKFEQQKSNAIMNSKSLSLLTMPQKVMSSIMSRIGMDESHLSDYQKQRFHFFEKNLLTNIFCEIIPLFDLNTIKDGKVEISFSELMEGNVVYYTVEEYLEHLQYISNLLKEHDNFCVMLVEEVLEKSYSIYVKEDFGTMVIKTDAPPVVLSINEINLTASFWGLLGSVMGSGYQNYQKPNKAEEGERLAAYIQQIQEACLQSDTN